MARQTGVLAADLLQLCHRRARPFLQRLHVGLQDFQLLRAVVAARRLLFRFQGLPLLEKALQVEFGKYLASASRPLFL